MAYDNETTKAGAVTDTTVWSAGHVPSALESICIKHNLSSADGNTISCKQIDMTLHGNFGRSGSSAGSLTLTATDSFNMFDISNGTFDAFDTWSGCVLAITAPVITWTNCASFIYAAVGGAVVTINGNVAITGGPGFGLLEPDGSISITVNGNVTLLTDGSMGSAWVAPTLPSVQVVINGNVIADANWVGKAPVFVMTKEATFRVTGDIDFSAAAVFDAIPPSVFLFFDGGNVRVDGCVKMNGPEGYPAAALCSLHGLSGSISVAGVSDPANRGFRCNPGAKDTPFVM